MPSKLYFFDLYWIDEDQITVNIKFGIFSSSFIFRVFIMLQIGLWDLNTDATERRWKLSSGDNPKNADGITADKPWMKNNMTLLN